MSVQAASPRILLVEDADCLRRAFGRLLRMHGYEVQEAGDGHAALDCLSRFHPQVVLTDLMMPVMDGFELISRLRRDPATSGLPILAITADGTDQARRMAREAGAQDVITKPVDMADLLDRLRVLEL